MELVIRKERRVAVIMNFMYMLEILPKLLSVLHITIIVLILTALFGLLFSVLITMIRVKKIRFLSSLMDMYISFTRSVPIVLQLFLVYYALPFLLSLIGINISNMSAFIAVVIALTFY